jgi:lipoprotein-anchoring transpeptidase ErfK/SrfK
MPSARRVLLGTGMRSWTLAIALLPLIIGMEAHGAQPRGSADRSVAPHPRAYEAADINRSDQPELDKGATGSAVARAQILLDRAHFSCGQIDGNFGANLQRTVTAYQQDRNLAQTGKVDAATWSLLNGDTAPALTSYVITEDDEKGPFVALPNDIMEQAKLPYPGYASPLDELGERFHTSPQLLQALNRGADFTAAGQQITVPNVVTMPPSGSAARVDVSAGESSVRVYDGDGKLMAFYMATIGSSHDPLPLGDWKVTTVVRNPTFHYDATLFWDAPNKDDRATVKPGPRNPVGLAKVGISKPNYGIHGTPDASKIGHTFSHGCIRLPNWDALELSSLVKRGMPVILKD